MSFSSAALVAAWAAIAVLSLAVVGLIHQIRLLAAGAGARMQTGPAIGSKAPPLNGQGEIRSSVLLFASAGCPGCEEVVPAFGRWAREAPVKTLLVYPGRPPASGEFVGVTVAEAQEVFEKWQIHVTPFAAAVGIDGRIFAAGPVGSASALADFIAVISDERSGVVAAR